MLMPPTEGAPAGGDLAPRAGFEAERQQTGTPDLLEATPLP